MKYDQLAIYKDAIGTAECRIRVDVPDNKSWRSSGLTNDPKEEMDEQWKLDISKGAEHMLETTYISPPQTPITMQSCGLICIHMDL